MKSEEYRELQKEGSKQISSSNVKSSEYDTMRRLLFESISSVVKNHYTGSYVGETATGYEITLPNGERMEIILKKKKGK